MPHTALIGLINAIDAFKLVAGSNPPLQLLQIFLYVASNTKCKQADLQEVTGLSESSCSRMIMWLGPTRHDGKKGLCLIRTESDPVFYKRKILFLTDKGHKVAALIQQNLSS
jgi:DNA-binding MarR family transcriptional regulator